MNKSFQKFGAWCGFIAINVFFIGVIIAGFFPPPSPSLSPDQVAQMYQENQFGILIGGLLIIVSAAFAGPFDAVIFLQLRRMEGNRPFGAYAQLASGIANIQFFIFPGLLFVIAAFRPDRAVDSLYALNDLAWIVTLLPWTVGAMQCLCIGIAVLNHGTATSAYPRWVGFFNIWIAVCMVVSSVIPFFKTGPFSWNGIFGFWIPGAVIGIWMMVMWWMTLKAANKDDGQ